MLPALLAALLLQAPDPVRDLVGDGDGWLARRAEGSRGTHAAREPIGRAMAAYRKALAGAPDDPDVRRRLLRALFFEATFCDRSPAERKALLEEARDLGEDGVKRLDARARVKGDARIRAFRGIPGAGELLYWTAVSWGEWAQTRGTFAAATQGAAGRIRELGEDVLAVDPVLEQGGGDRVLGRLHDLAPHIPLITGWVSRREAIAHLRAALRHDRMVVNEVFLAEALLRHEPEHTEEALGLLRHAASASPRAEFLVEDTAYLERARELLAARGQSPRPPR